MEFHMKSYIYFVLIQLIVMNNTICFGVTRGRRYA
jgi:hypothetical protein